MIIYKNYTTYLILNIEVNITSESFSFFRNTVAEINGNFYYLGSEPDNIESAIWAWQEYFNKELTSSELNQILIDNNFQHASKIHTR